VLAHARSMLHGVPGTAVIGRDMLEPDSILADPALRELIDFDEPVALLFLSILHFVADEADPARIIAKLPAPFPAGSHVAPGLAWPPEWRPDPGEEVPANAAESYYCVVVARTN